jgi:hypothetical protein
MDSQSSTPWQSVIRDWGAVFALVPVCAALVPISIVGACQWRAVREAEAAALKRDLIDRGLSPAEVERLAAPPDLSGQYRTQHADLAARLRQDLTSRGLKAEEVEAILRAWSEPAAGRYNRDTVERARLDADFVRLLLQQGRSAKEIERLLRAARPPVTAATDREAGAAEAVMPPAE